MLNKTKNNLPILFILLLSLGLRLVLINQSLWLDEAAQTLESSLPFTEQFKFIGDFQPPFFHIMLHFWMEIGHSEVWMRFLTVIISVISVYLFYKICQKLAGRKLALLAAFLFAINPLAVYYSQELRPYPLTVLLSLISVWGMFINSSLLVIIGVFLFLYTTYFAPFFIIGLLVCSFFYQRERFFWMLKNIFLAVLFFVPWLPSFIKQLNVGTSLTTTLPGWGEAVSLPVYKALPVILFKFFLGRITFDNKIIYLSFLALCLITLFYLGWKALKDRKSYLFLTVFLVPFVLTYLASFIIPVIDAKRILFTLPFFIGFLTFGLSKLKGLTQKICLTFIVLTSFLGLFFYYTNPRFQREQWRQAVAFVENQPGENELVLFAFPEPFAPFLWYTEGRIAAYGVCHNFVLDDQDVVALKNVIKNRDHIFFFQYLTSLTDPEGRIMSSLEEEGFIRLDTYDFSGVGFVYEYIKASLAVAP